MALPLDTSPEITGYAHPERLVSTQWLADHLGTPGLVVLESNEDVLLYDTGHIPGAVKIDWHTELNDPVMRDLLDSNAFAAVMSSKGISPEDTLVLYGDKSNWWAAYTLWVFTLFGHHDVRLLNGGRDAWISEGRELTKEVSPRPTTTYPVLERKDSDIRAFKEDVLRHFGNPLIDVRSPEEYSGERTHMPAYPEEGALPPLTVCPGRERPRKMADSRATKTWCLSTSETLVFLRAMTSLRIAESESAPVTPGLY